MSSGKWRPSCFGLNVLKDDNCKTQKDNNNTVPSWQRMPVQIFALKAFQTVMSSMKEMFIWLEIKVCFDTNVK